VARSEVQCRPCMHSVNKLMRGKFLRENFRHAWSVVGDKV